MVDEDEGHTFSWFLQALPRGRLTSELLDSSLTFATSGLAVPLALSSSVRLGNGADERTLEMGEQTWEAPETGRSMGKCGTCSSWFDGEIMSSLDLMDR